MSAARIPSWLMFLFTFLGDRGLCFVGIAAVINWTRGSEKLPLLLRQLTLAQRFSNVGG